MDTQSFFLTHGGGHHTHIFPTETLEKIHSEQHIDCNSLFTASALTLLNQCTDIHLCFFTFVCFIVSLLDLLYKS